MSSEFPLSLRESGKGETVIQLNSPHSSPPSAGEEEQRPKETHMNHWTWLAWVLGVVVMVTPLWG
ncbi:MAG: hypothetical protein ACREQV_26360, partial [Candidatus Binatia bacterium]